MYGKSKQSALLSAHISLAKHSRRTACDMTCTPNVSTTSSNNPGVNPRGHVKPHNH
ncbi:hypothetical protein BOTBODRAFT_33466, partial [Botryobasidium botryosum FD-172 SS1]